MAYSAPSPTDLKTRYPAFTAVNDETIDYWLEEASVECASWPDDARANAEMAYAAHRMAELGALNVGGVSIAGLTSFKSADFSATVSDAVASRTGYDATVYGREFRALQCRNFGGPYLMGAGCV